MEIVECIFIRRGQGNYRKTVQKVHTKKGKNLYDDGENGGSGAIRNGRQQQDDDDEGYNITCEHLIFFFATDHCFSPLSSFGPVFWCPVQTLWVNVQLPLFFVFEAVFNRLLIEHKHILSLVIVDQVKMLQRRYDVFFLDARHFTNFTKSNQIFVI